MFTQCEWKWHKNNASNYSKILKTRNYIFLCIKIFKRERLKKKMLTQNILILCHSLLNAIIRVETVCS